MNGSITKHLMFTKYFCIPFQTSLSIVSCCQTDVTLIKKKHTLKIYILCPAYYTMNYIW